MKTEEINEILRNVFQSLVNDGYKKRHICALTLGVQSEPQFETFLHGKDFGLKPLQRIIEAFGCEMNIIITEKNNSEVHSYARQTNKKFIDVCNAKLSEKLNDENLIKSSTVISTGILANISEEIFKKIK